MRRTAALEMAVTADYDAQSAVERELVLRLASPLWRLRRPAAIESGLFKIQAKHLLQFRQRKQAHQKRRAIIDGVYRNGLAAEDDAQRDDDEISGTTVDPGPRSEPRAYQSLSLFPPSTNATTSPSSTESWRRRSK